MPNMLVFRLATAMANGAEVAIGRSAPAPLRSAEHGNQANSSIDKVALGGYVSKIAQELPI